MDTTQIDDKHIYKNGVKIKVETESEGKYKPLNTMYEYPTEYETIIQNLLSDKKDQFNIEKHIFEENIIIQKGIGYSMGLSDFLVQHCVILENAQKIPVFEYVMYDLLTLLIEKQNYMPTCQLRDIFKEEEFQQPEPFGKLGYFIDLTDVDVVDFFSNQQSVVKTININDVISLMKEIQVYVGSNPLYFEYDLFIQRLNKYQSIDEIQNDCYYKLCSKRKVIPEFNEDDFSNIELISNEGGFGIVSSAIYKNMETVAMKNLINLRDSYHILSHKREFSFGRLLYDQPNIIEIKGCINPKTDGKQIIIMKKEKCSLKNYIDKNTIINKLSLYEKDPKQTLIMICDILIGTIAIRQNDIMFRDYKPANILVTDQNRCLICDLGTCTTTTGDILSLSNVNTSLYISDVYAIGMTLIQLFSTISLENKIGTINKNSYGNYTDFKINETIMKEEMNATIERIKNDENKIEYLTSTKITFEGLLKQSAFHRYKYDSLIQLLIHTLNYLNQKYNYIYQPLSKQALQMTDPMTIIHEGVKWIENIFTFKIHSMQFYELKEFVDRNKMEVTIQKEIKNFIEMMASYALYFSEHEDIEMFEGCLKRYQMIMSFHLLMKDKSYERYQNISEALFLRLIEMKKIKK